jgi:hypothetical protein
MSGPDLVVYERLIGMSGRREVQMRFISVINPFARVYISDELPELRASLWTSDAEPISAHSEFTQSLILEQYKMYVEMADRVSSRRSLANTFFLTLNTATFLAIGASSASLQKTESILLAIPTAALAVQCLAWLWLWLLRAYRQLNSAKYAVIAVLEEKLPASPYGRAEWAALKKGHDSSRYRPISQAEQWIPSAFLVMYLCGFALLALK